MPASSRRRTVLLWYGSSGRHAAGDWGVLLVGELGSVELGIETILSQQAGVGAPLNDATIVDDQ
jgi:hypothetical protein